ncbi:H(+)/Cl(-) exchange transporter ClcA [Clostridium saccharobutylicum]|uniref:ClC family H(+)/Cl(-) exchange transporter n=1 Tax=Clostridium saccharobutylicum TaxID=169679 RepID=UPI000983A14E|nr:ClC family H(+)/Cl(-) exchange transporter [Clostridium saccharobutylicum]AQS11053.1 H(+)/Cl(-) exchange transporter ClcA [Clostridium saccharobutylicum]MBC2437947.1 ClC family H(+)/Cl(-) exchange transporter [Clostridium saccharobutylicum]NSB90376.1 H+/Cl- antiporter ClcA [Clostridium saccharobutylicum]NYC32050.1 H+/Cl- antiporter ClcA [Clostridium saccharobutylicum]OOM14796.1 H(+)/Cl(-) exchange transporter ClcA [Clostridium saccharobutylicum]
MKTKSKQNTYNTLFHWHSFKLKLVFEGISIGIATGLLIVLYRVALEKAGLLLNYIYSVISIKPILILPWIISLIIIGYIVGLMVKAEPMISGSGIPQVEGVLLRKLDMTWWKVITGKFLGGVLSIGSGLSLGREGPSVQLGSAIGQGFSKIFKRINVEEKYLITSGASAGLAAAFNAPLAGAMFALEEVHKNFSPLILLSALSSALSADFIASGFFGLKPVFNFGNLASLPLQFYLYIILLGIILGILGVVFNKTLLGTQNLYARQKWLKKEFRIIIPLLISVILGILLPQVLGGGHELITSLAIENFSLAVLIIVLIVKFLFTMASFGSGAPGGIFLPLLTVGALIGNLYGLILVNFVHFDNMYITNFIILGMAGYFASVVKSPITGTILITEMTGSFNHLLSLAVVSIVSYIVADILGSKPVYESLLEKFLQNQGKKICIGNKRIKSILEFAVCMGSNLDNKQIKEIKWPAGCLLVAVKRGDDEILPKGDTVIFPGDYLIVLTNEDKVSKINDDLTLLSESAASLK